MQRNLFLFLLILFCTQYKAIAQDQNSIWVFGDSAGIDFTNVTNPIPITTGMDGRGSCTSISDSNGNLLFYSYTQGGGGAWTTTIKNFLHDSIPGADSITGEGWYNELIIIPRPDSSGQYYLFCEGSSTPNYGLYYTLIDMNQNFGQGVAPVQNIQLNPEHQGDCLSAVKHGNGRDWWVISKYASINIPMFNRFYVYLITPDSIHTPIIQDLGNAYDIDFQKVIFKASGDTFMLLNRGGHMGEYLFDRCNGTISLLREIYPQQTGPFDRFFWEGAYSTNGKFFYATTAYTLPDDINHLIQYDLDAPNIPLSADTLDSCYAPIGPAAVRLAPDSKIYYSRAYESLTTWNYPYPDSMRNYINENLSVINQPNNLGAACDFQQFSFYLGGKRTYYGLPNNPNYSLGRLVGSSCDTLYVSTSELSRQSIEIYPNPFRDKVRLRFAEGTGEKIVLRIIDSMGKMIHSKALSNSDQQFDFSFLPPGIYQFLIQGNEDFYSVKVVKM